MKKLCLLAMAVVFAVSAHAQLITSTTTVSERKIQREKTNVNVWYQGEVNFGYGLAGSISYNGESADAEFSRVFIETIHGARITKYAFVGLGTGVQYALDYEEAIIPVFLDLKGYYPVSDDFAPYVAFDLGYGIGTSDFDGGFYGSFGAGLNYRKLNFGLGYQMQGIGEGAKLGSFFLKVGLKF